MSVALFIIHFTSPELLGNYAHPLSFDRANYHNMSFW